ncbi:hypothetical protein [Flavobacterium columnare]|uniref:MORN repeat variant n=2 Tax=Flavobacterium TaxID=237 RepID=A0A2N9P6X5_9FLAO|nr:hypothetical protein [Flavobacterium columnare]RVU91030.1 hypothetical protein EH230_09045 [Flavobacterium columnare]SPE76091.1 hypothetical protein FLACOL_00069 [Flavobacterium columnare]
MKSYTLLYLLFFFSLTTCKQEKALYKAVVYTDVAFLQKKDSLLVDSIQQVKQNGFIRIFEQDSKSFEQGLLLNGMKVGKWQKYFDPINQNNKSQEYLYSNKGKLIKARTFDSKTQKIIEERNYLNDNLVGIQQDFYPTGSLHIKFETDLNGHFINHYIVLSQEGKKIYQTSLGQEGTGYIKYYDQTNHLIWEGPFKNKKKEGWHYQYLIDHEGKTTEKQSDYYKEDSLIQTKTEIF